MRIINIVDSLAPVNFGIWNAAINTAPALWRQHQIHSELWAPAGFSAPEVEGCTVRLLENTSLKTARQLLETLDRRTDIVVTHGCWQYPSKWGAFLARKGIAWVFVPHGMLEPWSMAQKRWKKKIYYYFLEGPRTRRAHGVRAVGSPEKAHLQKRYPKTVLIPNGYTPAKTTSSSHTHPAHISPPTIGFLYLSRLHEKKRPLQLLQAWARSSLANNPGYQLTIAGPDEGQLPLMTEFIARNPLRNVTLLGPTFGQEKEDLYANNHFFVLPSLSEGFPTSVVEAMGEGLIPMISQGCNFPESFAAHAALDCGTEVETIKDSLEFAARFTEADRAAFAQRSRQFSVTNYSLEAVARHQLFYYKSILAQHRLLSL